MGIYLNPGNREFCESVEKEIYIDKSLLIHKVWNQARKQNKYICISRPRRFGKSTDANMLTAYFSRGCDSRAIFDSLKIATVEDYAEQMNQHNVIQLNMQGFLSETASVEEMLSYLSKSVIWDLQREYPQVDYFDTEKISRVLKDICAQTGERFIFIIDEWDCIFREYREDKESQKEYLDYLRLLLKDQAYVEFAYMTGILPIKKYGTHSALNMFDEISMINPGEYAGFTGFTETEVQELCCRYEMDFVQMQEWYNGYHLAGDISVYSPRSVTAAISRRRFSNYWSQTETYDALKFYIDLNYDGLKEAVINLLAGEKVQINVRTFQNSMDSFATKDDILTLLIHLGYLGYLEEEKEVYIPNNEVKDTFVDSIETSDWNYITKVFQNANDLLAATWKRQAERVADYIQNSHYETSILQYNDENALAYTVSLAYITAREYYTIVRELPTGKGFADMVFIPKKEKPAMVIELKYDKTADTGIQQIKDKKYYLGLEKYLDNLLLVSINYDRQTKEHSCVIEQYNL